MATPFIDYYEHSLDMQFLQSTAYPFVREVAEFYRTYAVFNATTQRFDLLFTCAQEICDMRQLGQAFVQHNSLIDLAFAQMALRKAADWAGVLGVEPELAQAWAHLADQLAPYPQTTDPKFGNRPVWSEAYNVNPTTKLWEPAPFASNYMYPIVHFAAIHPGGLVGLGSSPEQLELAFNTVWGDNERSGWHPVNGFCLAWPSATRVTNRTMAPLLLDRFTAAVQATMQPNFWPRSEEKRK